MVVMVVILFTSSLDKGSFHNALAYVANVVAIFAPAVLPQVFLQHF